LYVDANDIEVMVTTKITDLTQHYQQTFNLEQNTTKYFRINVTDYGWFNSSISLSIYKVFGDFQFKYIVY